MTAGHGAPERDWDGDFDLIARRLGDLDGSAAEGRSAARDTVVDTPAQPAPAETRTNTGDRVDGDHVEGTAILHAPASADETPGVPGFKSQWRLAPEQEPPTVDADDDTDEEFQPPEPSPIGLEDPATLVMIACLVLAPLWLLYLVVFDRDASGLTWALAAAALLTGFALAVARQPHTREDDGDDDGARV